MAYAVLLICIAVARVSSAQTFTTLVSFDGTINNGANPFLDGSGALIQGIDGNLDGTIRGGGAYSGGTVFQITPAGAPTTLYSFCAQTNCADGKTPEAGLVQATNGNFHRIITLSGGTYSDGTVVELHLKTGRTPFDVNSVYLKTKQRFRVALN